MAHVLRYLCEKLSGICNLLGKASKNRIEKKKDGLMDGQGRIDMIKQNTTENLGGG